MSKGLFDDMRAPTTPTATPSLPPPSASPSTPPATTLPPEPHPPSPTGEVGYFAAPNFDLRTVTNPVAYADQFWLGVRDPATGTLTGRLYYRLAVEPPDVFVALYLRLRRARQAASAGTLAPDKLLAAETRFAALVNEWAIHLPPAAQDRLDAAAARAIDTAPDMLLPEPDHAWSELDRVGKAFSAETAPWAIGS